MKFRDILKYFSSKSNEAYPYSVVPTSQAFVYDVIRNYSVETNVSLVTGIYFEILGGNLANSQSVLQTFFVRIKNPNSLNINSLPLVLNLYSVSTNSLVLLSSINISNTPANDSIISTSATAQNFLITLETTTGSQILYTSEDYLNGNIPVNQNIKAVVTNSTGSSVEYYIFFKEPRSQSFLGVNLNTRSTSSKIYSNYTSDVDDIYVYHNSTNNIIGVFTNENVVTDYKFPRTYLFVPQISRNRLNVKSLLFSYFVNDIYSDTINFSYLINESFLNNLQKLRGFIYNSYSYQNASYIPLDNYASIRNILLILFLIKEKYSNLSSTKQLYYDSLLNYIRTYIFDTLLHPLVPDYVTSSDEDQFSLSTNLLLLDLYRFFGLTLDYDSLKIKIENEFLNSSIYEIINTSSVQPITQDNPLSLYLIKFLLPVHFPGQYSNIIADIDNKLLNLSVSANVTPIIESSVIDENFNPIYTFNPVVSSEILYRTNFSTNFSAIDFSDNLIIKYLQGNNNIINLYSPGDSIYLGVNKFSIAYNLFILPNLFSSLLNEYFRYSSSIVSLYSYVNVEITPPTTIQVVNYSIRQIGNQLDVTIELNAAARIMYVIFNKTNPAIMYYYFISNSSSITHNFYINISVYGINASQMDSGIIILR